MRSSPVSNDVAAVAEKADAFIRSLLNELETVKAKADASDINAEQSCSLIEQEYLSLAAEFSKLESRAAELQATLDQRLAELAEVQTQKERIDLQSIEKDREIERLRTEVSELHKSKRQLIELNEQKDLQLSEKNAAITSYLDKIVNLSENAAQKDSHASELEAELSRSRAECTRLSQADLRRRERDYNLALKEITDLPKQVTVLLKECQDIQLRCGSIGLDAIDKAAHGVSSIHTETDAEKVISEHLMSSVPLTFKDMNGLVEQNVQLRRLARNLSDQIENKELEFKERLDMELRKHTEEAANKVTALLRSAEEQGRLIESLHTSVAMSKRLYEEEHSLHLSHSSPSEAPTADADGGRNNLKAIIESSQEATKKSLEKAMERVRCLEDDLAKSRSENIILRSERDKSALEANFARERLDSFLKEFEQQKAEANGILARNVEFSQLIVDYRQKLRESSESLNAAEELSRKLSVEISVLKNEKEIISNTEKRASDQVRSLSERVQRLEYFLRSSLGTIQSAEEIPEEAMPSERRKQEEYMQKSEVTTALRKEVLESSNLILGIDFTKSNEWTGKVSFNNRSLHAIGSTPNPYEKAISIVGKTLAPFDGDNLIPCFGFGDATTHDQEVFSFHSDHSSCRGFEEVLACYQKVVPHLKLSGPTSYGPVIEAAIDIVEKNRGQFHVLFIIADGQVTRSVNCDNGELSPQEQKTIQAIVDASSYPLSIVLIGVGDGPWEDMKKFDDKIPARDFDNFQFVNFTDIMSKNSSPAQKEAAFALAALMEIPFQYKAVIELGILGRVTRRAKKIVPRPPPVPYSRPAPSDAASSTDDKLDQQACSICLTNAKDLAFGCGHMTCRDCGSRLTNCPICREQITKRLRVFPG